MSFFWNGTHSRLVVIYRRFGATYRAHLLWSSCPRLPFFGMWRCFFSEDTCKHSPVTFCISLPDVTNTRKYEYSLPRIPQNFIWIRYGTNTIPVPRHSLQNAFSQILINGKEIMPISFSQHVNALLATSNIVICLVQYRNSIAKWRIWYRSVNSEDSAWFSDTNFSTGRMDVFWYLI